MSEPAEKAQQVVEILKNDIARKPRGFAAMDRALVAWIASKGGKAAHVAGTAHEFTPEEARAAGQRGGRTTAARRTAKKAGLA